MKNSVLLISLLMLLGCNNNYVEKPNNLVDEDKMEQILYDLAILESLKSQNTTGVVYPTPSQYIKQKYDIDSVTFAKSTKYYASDVPNYRKMYEKVKDKLAQDRDAAMKQQ